MRKNPSSGKRVLLLHGLCSSPWELSSIERILKTKGYATLTPTLADLQSYQHRFSGFKYQVWLENIEQAIGLEKWDTKRFTIVGTSLGGILAAKLATMEERVEKIVLINPPFELRNFWIRLLLKTGAIRNLRLPLKIPVGYEKHYFPYFPLELVRALHTLAHDVMETADRIRIPTHIFYSLQDRTIQPEAIRIFLRKIASRNGGLHLLPKAPHSPLSSAYPNHQEIIRQVVDIL